MVSLTKSFALDVAPDGILVNPIAPEPLAAEKAKSMNWYEGALTALPTGNPIEPDEITETPLYLSRPENISLTRENIVVSDGCLMR